MEFIMADYNLAQTGNLSPEDFAQQQQLNRQQQMAQLLMQQSAQPQGQMISGRYVAPSWAQSLVPLANIAASKYIGEKADTEAAKLAQKIRETKGAKEEAITNLITGKPEVSTELAGPYAGNVPQPRAVSQEAIKPDLAAALREISTNNPYGAGAEYKATILGNLIPKKTDKLIEYETYKSEGGTKKFSDWAREITPEQQARLDIDRQRLGLEGARFQLDKSMKDFEMGGGKLNDEQGKAVGFGTRAKEASAILSKLEGEGVKDVGKIRSTVGSTLGMTPLIGEKLEQNVMSTANVLPGFLGGPNEQQQATLQARKNFATAVLRKESGASISPTEFADVERIYFPAPGDDANILRQKQRARDLAINALEVQAGPGARFIKEFKPQTDFSNESSGWRLK